MPSSWQEIGGISLGRHWLAAICTIIKKEHRSNTITSQLSIWQYPLLVEFPPSANCLGNEARISAERTSDTRRVYVHDNWHSGRTGLTLGSRMQFANFHALRWHFEIQPKFLDHCNCGH